MELSLLKIMGCNGSLRRLKKIIHVTEKIYDPKAIFSEALGPVGILDTL